MIFNNLEQYVSYNINCLEVLDEEEVKEMTLEDKVNYIYEYARESAERELGKHFNWRFFGKENILKEIKRQLVRSKNECETNI